MNRRIKYCPRCMQWVRRNHARRCERYHYDQRLAKVALALLWLCLTLTVFSVLGGLAAQRP